MSTALVSMSARNALAILKDNNSEVNQASNRISTGLKVSTAADNAALWSISRGFQAEIAGYEALSEGLSLGSSTVAVGRSGAESVTSLLTDIKTEIINASAAGASTSAIQSTIDSYVDQIQSVVGAASFNGVNLLQNRLTASESNYSVLSSIDDTGAGQSINVGYQDLQTDALSFGTAAATTTNYFGDAGNAALSGALNIDIASGTVAYGASYQVSIAGNGAHAFGGAQNFQYVARNGDTNADVATALYDQIDDYISANGLSSSVSVSLSASSGRVTVTNLDGVNTLNVANSAATGGTAGGGLAGLDAIDVTTAQGRSDALAAIDTWIDTATNAAAALGSSEKRINTQIDFLSSVSNSIAAGMSALVDADMEEESAKLAAAEVQREMALYVLSIANSQPQRLVELLRGG